jgi:hypothetical protein
MNGFMGVAAVMFIGSIPLEASFLTVLTSKKSFMDAVSNQSEVQRVL